MPIEWDIFLHKPTLRVIQGAASPCTRDETISLAQGCVITHGSALQVSKELLLAADQVMWWGMPLQPWLWCFATAALALATATEPCPDLPVCVVCGVLLCLALQYLAVRGYCAPEWLATYLSTLLAAHAACVPTVAASPSESEAVARDVTTSVDTVLQLLRQVRAVYGPQFRVRVVLDVKTAAVRAQVRVPHHLLQRRLLRSPYVCLAMFMDVVFFSIVPASCDAQPLCHTSLLLLVRSGPLQLT